MTSLTSRDIFGAEIQYFRLDPRYWERMLRVFKDAGLRCVTAYVPWSTHLAGPPDAQHPAGVLDFTGRTDPRRNLLGFLELVEKHGLDLNFRCGPFCCNEMVHGGYPEWLVLGDPGLMVWDCHDRPAPGYWIARKEGAQPSYLHPVYLDWCRKWIGEVDGIIVPHLKRHGGCVTMINLDNEVSYIVQDGFLSSDYNPVNVAPGGFYHQFLAEKYGSAARLPYDRACASIDQVPAPRAVPESLGADVAWYLDWCEFKQWVMAGYIGRLREMHEANGVSGATFMTNFNPHRPEGVPTRMPAFDRATRSRQNGGVAGYDFYRSAFMTYSGYQSMARVLKLMTASLPYTYSAEFMSGTWNKVLASRVSDDHMRFMARCALAHGCKAIAWFMFHDRECWGDAPVSSHGHTRPSLDVLRETCDLAGRRIREWDELRPQGDVAVLYDLVQHRHTYLGDPSPCNDQAMHVGKPTIAGVEAGRDSAEYEGLFRLVEMAGVQPAAVDLMHDSSRLRQHPLAFLPGSPIIETEAAQTLREYVEAGGVLVISGPWPSVNERGQPLAFLGIGVPAPSPEAVTLTQGAGRVVWHGGYLGQEPPEEEAMDHVAFVRSLIRRHVPRPHVHIEPVEEVAWTDWHPKGGAALYRQPRNLGSAVLQAGPTQRILFVLNHYPEAARFRLRFGEVARGSLRNLFGDETIGIADYTAVVDIDRKSGEVYEIVS